MPKDEVIPSALEDIPQKRDRTTLGTLMAGIKKWKVIERECKLNLQGDKKTQRAGLVEEAALLMQGYGIKTLSFSEKLFTVVSASKTSYSRDNLTKAMMKFKVHPDTIVKILAKAGTPCEYTTLQMRDEKQSDEMVEVEDESEVA
jgi:hypothetical protein